MGQLGAAGGGAATAVARLKRDLEKDARVQGSGELVPALMRTGLVDEFVLLVHPLVLGAGRRLFVGGGAAAAVRLISSSTTPEGVIMTAYWPVS